MTGGFALVQKRHGVGFGQAMRCVIGQFDPKGDADLKRSRVRIALISRTIGARRGRAARGRPVFG